MKLNSAYFTCMIEMHSSKTITKSLLEKGSIKVLILCGMLKKMLL